MRLLLHGHPTGDKTKKQKKGKKTTTMSYFFGEFIQDRSTDVVIMPEIKNHEINGGICTYVVEVASSGLSQGVTSSGP